MQDPPSLLFIVGDATKSLATIDRGIAQLRSPEEEDDERMLPTEDADEWPLSARRLMWEILQLASEAPDYFRGEIVWWDLDERG